ncbi:hypothetical protein ACI797_21090 [Geodermatophilus sp. SYSU D00691]
MAPTTRSRTALRCRLGLHAWTAVPERDGLYVSTCRRCGRTTAPYVEHVPAPPTGWF